MMLLKAMLLKEGSKSRKGARISFAFSSFIGVLLPTMIPIVNTAIQNANINTRVILGLVTANWNLPKSSSFTSGVSGLGLKSEPQMGQ